MPIRMHAGVSFRFISSYLGSLSYEVDFAGKSFRIVAVVEACDYHRSIYNGGSDRFDREVVPTVGCLVRDHDVDQEVPIEVVKAFNSMRAADYREVLAWVESKPGLRESLNCPLEEIVPPPVAFRRARWVEDSGTWIRH